VRRLAGGPHAAGTHTVSWDGRDDDGVALSSGVYFYRVRGGRMSETRKLLLTR
jgi:flagellar hook assembly protein FlgD